MLTRFLLSFVAVSVFFGLIGYLFGISASNMEVWEKATTVLLAVGFSVVGVKISCDLNPPT